MHRLRHFQALTALSALLFIACGGDAAEQSANQVLDPAAVMAQAEADYALYCALCHGEQGEGYAADNANALNHPAFLATSTDEFLRAGIERGRPGTPMSAWGVSRGGPLDEAAVDGLVMLMRSWQQGEGYDVSGIEISEDAKASRGAAQYAARCAFCHGDQGEGGAYMSVANPEFLASASDGFIREAIRSGREGTAMGAYSEILTEQAIDDIVALIRSWQTPIDTSDVTLPSTELGDPVLNAGGPKPVFAEGRYISADLLHAQLNAGASVVLLDARPPLDYVTGHITGAVSVPFYDVASFTDQLPTDVPLVVYCGCPHAESTAAAEVLESSGFQDVKVIDEGYYYWRDEGYPIVQGVEPGDWPQPVEAVTEPNDVIEASDIGDAGSSDEDALDDDSEDAVGPLPDGDDTDDVTSEEDVNSSSADVEADASDASFDADLEADSEDASAEPEEG